VKSYQWKAWSDKEKTGQMSNYVENIIYKFSFFFACAQTYLRIAMLILSEAKFYNF